MKRYDNQESAADLADDNIGASCVPKLIALDAAFAGAIERAEPDCSAALDSLELAMGLLLPESR